MFSLKIGILTYHRAENYGAFLQAYGLCQRLNEEYDIQAEIIDFHTKAEYIRYTHRNYTAFSEIRHLLWVLKHYPQYRFKKQVRDGLKKGLDRASLSMHYLMSDSIEDFQEFVRNKYDIIIAGSDEIWKLDGFRGFPTPYWLPGNLGCIKVSYAASSRNDLSKIDASTLKKIQEYLNDFQYISVRDELTKNNIIQYVRPQAIVKVYPDPSFIYDYNASRDKGREILKRKIKINPLKKIAIVMTEDSEIAEIIRKELSYKYQLIAIYSRHEKYYNLGNLDPFEWINIIAGADFVCASFFHAICFAIINHTPFCAFAADGKTDKLEDLLKNTKNIDRLVKKNDYLFKNGFLKEKIEQLSNQSNDDTFIKESRIEFSEYVDILRKMYKITLEN